MPFPFRYICDLLQDLDDEVQSRKKTTLTSKSIVEKWFRHHRQRLDASTVDKCAVLSTLLPESRTDRVYGIQVTRLESIVNSALALGYSRAKELRRYHIPGLAVDLGDCVESILKSTPNPTRPTEVTVEEIDETLHNVAAACRFSSTSIRGSRVESFPASTNQELGHFYQRLSARDAKWFTRLVLKNYEPVVLQENTILRNYHALLPQILKVRGDLLGATQFLQNAHLESYNFVDIAAALKPTLGIKVGRQTWLKGRSIKHCMDMGGQRQISCEQKLDGEYCQIHIDLRKAFNPIQIFSKSGKDSTQDRKGLHQAIRESLQLGTKQCPIKVGCILEGELVVYSSKDQKILPFHKIRKHVSRSGSFLGTARDSQPHEYEHLMIVYFDVIMIDDESLLGTKNFERFQRLENLVTCRKGHAELVKRQLIPLAERNAASKLREAFASCITTRKEGLVLKPNDPYFDFSRKQLPYSSCYIKLKKEYVQGWGDVGDFAVVGASYDAAKAKSYKLPNLQWTHFYIGCLENRCHVEAQSAKPHFIVTNIVQVSGAQLKTIVRHCNPVAIPYGENESIRLDLSRLGITPLPTFVFPEPIVFDMRCFSFDKPANSRTWSMRFPMVSKIHHDRSYLDSITFGGLQEAAASATEVPDLEDSQEMRQWISALEAADPRGIPVDAISQESTYSEMMDSARPQKVNNQPKIIDTEETNPVNPAVPSTQVLRAVGRRQPGLQTSSTSSPPETPLQVNAPASGHVEAGRKRATGLQPPILSSKRQRRIDPNSSPPKTRVPLAAVDGNSSQTTANKNTQDSGVGTVDELVAISPHEKHSRSFSSVLTSSAITSSQPRQRLCIGNIDNNLEFPAELNAGFNVATSCQHRGSTCAFSQTSLLLSPCISHHVWITGCLLRFHGVNEYLVEPETWAKQSASSVGPTGDTRNRVLSGLSTKRPRIRKICLVESKNTGPTQTFLERLGRVGLTLASGQHEWVSVYDWRVLEDITKIESGLRLQGPDPWMARYIGIV
ncbi:hypothetical protein BX600DRAFT_472501 [Xylariales sp. PMI_506]|nr:hypothetical protein BX600DRAFT_472501 [Xylariales sp. PMI_506]